MASSACEGNGEDKSEVYLATCGLCRWRLNLIRGLNPMINGIHEMRKYGVEMTLHIGYQFGDFDLCT
jgi:hypothetical protein